MPLSKFQKTQDQHIHSLLPLSQDFLQEVVRTIRTGLGRPLEELFRDFGQRPIASASVGQDGPAKSHVNETQCDILGIYIFFYYTFKIFNHILSRLTWHILEVLVKRRAGKGWRFEETHLD